MAADATVASIGRVFSLGGLDVQDLIAHCVTTERRNLLTLFGRFWHACGGCGPDISLHSLLARNAVLVNHDGIFRGRRVILDELANLAAASSVVARRLSSVSVDEQRRTTTAQFDVILTRRKGSAGKQAVTVQSVVEIIRWSAEEAAEIHVYEQQLRLTPANIGQYRMLKHYFEINVDEKGSLASDSDEDAADVEDAMTYRLSMSMRSCRLSMSTDSAASSASATSPVQEPAASTVAPASAPTVTFASAPAPAPIKAKPDKGLSHTFLSRVQRERIFCRKNSGSPSKMEIARRKSYGRRFWDKIHAVVSDE